MATTYTTNQFYVQERSNTQSYSKGIVSYIDYIGLMYTSDFGYSLNGGIDGEVWSSQKLYNNRTSYRNNAWLYHLEGKYYEWTITPDTGLSASGDRRAWFINYDGSVNFNSVSDSRVKYGIRPSFYLKSSVRYASGEGSIEEPYRIKIS